MTQTISSRVSSQRDKPPDFNSMRVQSDEFNQIEAQKAVQQALAGLEIVHVTAERIRIRATDGISSAVDAIIERLQQQAGIKQVTWNEETQSLVIAFDKEVLPQSRLLAVLAEYGIRRSSDFNQKIPSDPFAAWKSIEFWKEQGIDLIPLLTGLALTSRLGVTGLASIPIYMLTADVTRRTISSFRQAWQGNDESQDETKSSKASKDESKGKLVTRSNRTSQPFVSEVQKSSTIERESLNDAIPHANEFNVQRATTDYSIVHSIPGRIRFNVPRLAKDKSYARRLEKLLNSESHVTKVRISSDAASVAISYQPASLDASHWVGLIQFADQTVSSTVQKPFNQVEKKPAPSQPHPAEAVVTQPINQLNIPIIQVTTPEVASYKASSIIADLKPPFINVLIDVVARFPLS
jgi:Heavy metal associated domain 2